MCCFFLGGGCWRIDKFKMYIFFFFWDCWRIEWEMEIVIFFYWFLLCNNWYEMCAEVWIDKTVHCADLTERTDWLIYSALFHWDLLVFSYLFLSLLSFFPPFFILLFPWKRVASFLGWWRSDSWGIHCSFNSYFQPARRFWIVLMMSVASAMKSGFSFSGCVWMF